eukprot:TRINITY_DN57394_c0_g1_i1.p2 TRINITY_DN57394_c0_g1~~TRINITY_DN57394_c0_g1_i1.p2  ORF type:complete len:165 (-),score=27.33 TRINITY_DN57394_c0_g1_i1:119-613(-)
MCTETPSGRISPSHPKPAFMGSPKASLSSSNCLTCCMIASHPSGHMKYTLKSLYPANAVHPIKAAVMKELKAPDDPFSAAIASASAVEKERTELKEEAGKREKLGRKERAGRKRSDVTRAREPAADDDDDDDIAAAAVAATTAVLRCLAAMDRMTELASIVGCE